MKGVDLGIIEVLFLSISSLSSLFVAFLAYVAIRQSDRTNRANIFIDLSKRYASTPIAESFREIKFWRDRCADDFASVFWQNFLNEDEEAKRIDEYNRNISLFYLDVSKAYKMGALDKRMARTIVSRFGFTIYRDICIPLWKKIYNDENFQGEIPTLNKFHTPRWRR